MTATDAAPLPRLSRVAWERAFRIIKSAYPPIDLFEDIADPADWELLASAESKTNPRIRQQLGDISLVPVERRVAGPGASWAMAPFTHVSPARKSRFSDGTYGVYYAGDRFEVALAETVYHYAAFLGATAEPPLDEDVRVLVARVDARLHDIRGDRRFAECLAPDDYGPSQALARRLRDEAGGDGIVYPSVRWPAGEALAAFWPDVVGRPVQSAHLCYHWDGSAISRYFVYGEEEWRPVPAPPAA